MSNRVGPFDRFRIRWAANHFVLLAAAASVLTTTCVGNASSQKQVTPPQEILPVLVTLGNQHQIIAGFGASSAWTTPSLTDAEADEFFSPDTGIGLSLLRVRIAPDGTTDELATAQSAVARGVSVWATPWSPPAEWKSNDSTTNGGYLIPDYAQAWANQLAAFATQMASAGVPLLALSAQNEPGYVANWETCLYSPTQLVGFIRDNLGPALTAQGLTIPILAPETQNWNSFASYADPIVADTQCAAYVGILATHDYGGTPFLYASASAVGKQVWETEVYDGTAGSDPGIDSGLRVAKMIHDHLIIAEVNAWHYWWLKPNADTAPDNSALTTIDGQVTGRAYALGNWSRFVRPGFVRVDATASPQDYVYVTAFADPVSGRVVIVAINLNSTGVEQVFSIPGSLLAAMTPWITSADLALTSADPVALADAGFTFTLPGRSVTTFVGDP
ncbi:MAG: glycoside hydrolase [Polyangia bacterium]|jgi:glucuronoarabinoxylan endo-1,4-beta-xylanase